MKITLPPVAQVTAGTTVAALSTTQHHRHRSLDLDLHRIPEVDVTPSPEVTANSYIMQKIEIK